MIEAEQAAGVGAGGRGDGCSRFIAQTGNAAEPAYFNKLRYGRDYFLGGELRFTDEDLGSMVRIYGAMLVALLIGS